LKCTRSSSCIFFSSSAFFFSKYFFSNSRMYRSSSCFSCGDKCASFQREKEEAEEFSRGTGNEWEKGKRQVSQTKRKTSKR
jgi:hypothetical protein